MGIMTMTFICEIIDKELYSNYTQHRIYLGRVSYVITAAGEKGVWGSSIHGMDMTEYTVSTNTYMSCLCQYPSVLTDDFLKYDKEMLQKSHIKNSFFAPLNEITGSDQYR